MRFVKQIFVFFLFVFSLLLLHKYVFAERLVGQSAQSPVVSQGGRAHKNRHTIKHFAPYRRASLRREHALRKSPRYQFGSEEAKAIDKKMLLGGGPYGYFDASRFKRGITVTTSPLLGLRSAYTASDLLFEYPSMNEDLIFLAQRQYFEYHLLDVGTTLENRAILVLSGGVEGQVIYSRGFAGANNNDVNLSNVQLDLFAMVSTWANALVVYSFDDSTPSSGSRTENSRIYISRGFLTIGNLEQSPFYFSIGQMYLPFGKYQSALLTTPLVKSLGRILGRAALIGVSSHGLYSEVYGYRGNRVGTGTKFLFKQGGFNIGYQKGDFDIGTGYVSNMADSEGMQDNGINPFLTSFRMGTNIREAVLSEFGGFGITPGADCLVHNFPALDFHMEYAMGPLEILIEYIAGVKNFSRADATFNNHGALPQVGNIELDFTMTVRNTIVLIGFYAGQTWQALEFNVPQTSYAIIASASFWKNTMIGIEYRHDVNYSQKIPTGATGHELPVPSANVGGTRNTVSFQIGAYF